MLSLLTYALWQDMAIDFEVFVHLTSNDWHWWVQTERLIQRGLGVLEARQHVGRWLIGTVEHLRNLVDHLLFDIGVRGDQVQRPQQAGTCGIVTFKLRIAGECWWRYSHRRSACVNLP
jgi:hypothetical protein